MNKPLLKLSHINIKEKNWRVNGVSCMRIMSHQVLRIPSTQSSCPHTVYILQTIQSIWFFFQAPLQTGQVYSFLFLFRFFVFTGCFSLNSVLLCLGLIWFLLILVALSWSCCSFLYQGELVIISDFSLHRFVRLSNLRAFK